MVSGVATAVLGVSARGRRGTRLQLRIVDALEELDKLGHDTGLDDFLNGGALFCSAARRVSGYMAAA
jgi:hypothetical protein